MEEDDLKLIERLVLGNKVLEHLMKQHYEFERKLEEYQKKPYLTPEEEVEKRRTQKLKLAGRDRIEAILVSHRQKQPV